MGETSTRGFRVLGPLLALFGVLSAAEAQLFNDVGGQMQDAGKPTAPLAGDTGRTTSVLVTQYAECAGNDAVDDSTGINAAIRAVAVAGGGQVVFPNGTDCRVKKPVILQSQVHLVGQGSLGNTPATPNAFTSVIRPSANMAAVVTQSSFASFVQGVGILGMQLDGRVGTYTVTDLVRLSPVEGLFRDNQITNGSGNCLNLSQNRTGTSWVETVEDNVVGGCTGYGLIIASTDSDVHNNYISGNAAGQILANGGGNITFSDNQIEKSAGKIGLEIQLITTQPTTIFFPYLVTGNRFNLNSTDVKITNGSSGALLNTELHLVGNDYFWPGAGSANVNIDIDSNIQGGDIDENFAGGYPTIANVRWGGANNAGWRVSGISSLSNSSRFVNLPRDALVSMGGPSGQSNQVSTITATSKVTSPSFMGGMVMKVTALNAATVTTIPYTAAGMIVLRDTTLGGGAIFILDPNGETSVSNSIAGLTMQLSAGHHSVTITSGTVPRKISYTFIQSQ